MSALTQETSPELSLSRTPDGELARLLTHAGFAPADELGWVRVTGEDRVRWLNGMATNSIQSLAPGEGCYNFFLNAQGRIQADATAWATDDALLLETEKARIPALLEMLDRFIIMDDVELAPVEDRAGLLVVGPEAESILAGLGLPVAGLPEMRLAQGTIAGAPVDVVHAYSPLIPRFELWTASAHVAQVTKSLADAGAFALGTPAIEELRIAEGTPRFGVDIRDRDLPQETAQPGESSRALHFSKGCYLGQEIVERIRSRGNLHRTFSGFELAGELPAPGTPLFDPAAPEKPVGELTSAAHLDLPGGPVLLALGYLRREALERGRPLRYSSGTARPIRLPVDLPARKSSGE